MNYPLVSVVTPVYNGEKYLSECIESVLAQAYPNWEYIIADNCSTDRTMEIAESYAKADKRVKIYHFEEFVEVIQSHNRAFGLISSDSKYCKVLPADDLLFPDCLTRLVELAEANPSVGIVGSYLLRGGGDRWEVLFDGLPYTCSIISGREMCRSHLLGGPYVFGCPTSVLYRSDLMRNDESFYPNTREQADTSVCYKVLKDADFGIVHQVLSYLRVHKQTLSTEAFRIGTHEGSCLIDLVEYGPAYLTKEELERRTDEVLSDYYAFLAVGVLKFKDAKYWRFHKAVLRQIRAPFLGVKLVKAVLLKLMDWLFNPKHTVEQMTRKHGRHPQKAWK